MIILFTDFGLEGPYVGQMKAVLAEQAPGWTVIDLCHDVPPHRPDLAAYLLAAYRRVFPGGSIFIGVVDPGVGGLRDAVLLEAGGHKFVGPDNGLLVVAARHAAEEGESIVWRRITWRPPRLSASFHGRDLFAPAAAKIATGNPLATETTSAPVGDDWPGDAAKVIYIDRFGNAITGLRAGYLLKADDHIAVGGRRLAWAETFSSAPPGACFWYENANGLVELAANGDHAADLLSLRPGDAITVIGGAAVKQHGVS